MPDSTPPVHWWKVPGALARFIADMIDAEARLLRPGGPGPPRVDPARLAMTAPGDSGGDDGGNGLGLDSLERLALAAAFSEALHLHRGGLADTLLTAPNFGGWVEAASAALDRFGGLMTVRSSGSSGRPRRHVHPMARLEAEAGFWAGVIPGRLRVRGAVASHSIYGLLFTLMLPARLGLPVDDLRPLSPGAVIATLRPGDLVIGHPVFWEALLRAAPSDWPPDVIAVSSGAPCTDETAGRLIAAGLARLLEIYGSSETAGIGWRERRADGWNDGGAYRLLPVWRRGADGRLARDGEPPVELPDMLHWNGSGGFRLGARHDGAVMIGGMTVDPARVRDVLRAHPDVADVAIRAMGREEGGRLKAFVVPRDHAAGDGERLRAALTLHVDTMLTVPERPRAFRFGSVLPLSATGKPADWPA